MIIMIEIIILEIKNKCRKYDITQERLFDVIENFKKRKINEGDLKKIDSLLIKELKKLQKN